MLIPPKYRFTTKISELLSSIEASKEVIGSVTILPEIEMNLRRQSTLKSSLYSARIEGNTLVMDDINNISPSDRKRVEVFNILRAKNWIHEKKTRQITSKDILFLHGIVMSKLIGSENLGRYRKNMEAIFNSAGMVVFMPPPPRMIDSLIDKLIKYIHDPKEKFGPTKAVVAHYSFEKIHPFLDGSGRVGRLLMQVVLNSNGYGMKGILNIEEYLDQKREEYYRMLEEPQKDITNYIEFMLEAVAKTACAAKKMIIDKQKFDPIDSLLPRRCEILKIIREHKIVNVDQIKRRFSKVNERTIRNDLKKLQDQGSIQKLGTTKGVYYRPKGM